MSQLVVRYWSCTARSEQGHEVNEEKKREREVESNLKHFAHFRRKNHTVSFGARNFRSFKIGFFFRKEQCCSATLIIQWCILIQ